MGKVMIDQIPESDVNVMSRSLLRLVEAYFDDPVNKADFERWLEEQKGGKPHG